jgi:hypothetical protein
MTTAFVNGTGKYFLNLLPRSRSMDINYFAGEIIRGLKDARYPEGRSPHQKKLTLRFDKAPIHKNAHGTIRVARVQEDGTSAFSSGFGPL